MHENARSDNNRALLFSGLLRFSPLVEIGDQVNVGSRVAQTDSGPFDKNRSEKSRNRGDKGRVPPTQD